MKRKDLLNNKKGFTLVELLAVIVILAVVATIGISTVLPSMAEARKNAFATEANSVIDAASNATALIEIGSVTSDFTKLTSGTPATETGDYCFSVEDLVDLGLYKNGEGKSGVVIAKKISSTGTSSKGYKYYAFFTNGKYYVNQTTAGTISTESTSVATIIEGTATDLTLTACSATMTLPTLS